VHGAARGIYVPPALKLAKKLLNARKRKSVSKQVTWPGASENRRLAEQEIVGKRLFVSSETGGIISGHYDSGKNEGEKWNQPAKRPSGRQL